MKKQKDELTTQPVSAADSSAAPPEFGRHSDVKRLYGIKRSTLYNLIREKKVKSVLLRVKGAKSGLRLIHLASVRDLIISQMNLAEQETQARGECVGNVGSPPDFSYSSNHLT